ncbi:hypothetical protein [Streptomyces lydicus]|uniref:hypothetical protein n=1 Tax=Streptomyces lydicus TaxID=47763 RepID=UPI00379821E2
MRVTGRFRGPGVLTGRDILCADVLVSASFVDARLREPRKERDNSERSHHGTRRPGGGVASRPARPPRPPARPCRHLPSRRRDLRRGVRCP